VTRVVPVLGTALVGLAVAFILRALTEMDLIPVSVGVALAVVYAFLWLVYASRAREGGAAAAAIQGATAFLILAPLLWEAHTRFQVMPSWLTAAILVGFAAFGAAASWTAEQRAVAWIAVSAGLLTSSALLWATRDLVPFTSALLALAVLVEAPTCLGRWRHERWRVARPRATRQ
jgi:hypothetical protein